MTGTFTHYTGLEDWDVRLCKWRLYNITLKNNTVVWASGRLVCVMDWETNCSWWKDFLSVFYLPVFVFAGLGCCLSWFLALFCCNGSQKSISWPLIRIRKWGRRKLWLFRWEFWGRMGLLWRRGPCSSQPNASWEPCLASQVPFKIFYNLETFKSQFLVISR